MLATAGRAGLEPAVPFVSGSFLGGALRADAQARIDRDPSQSSDGHRSVPVALAVAAPVRHGDRVLGALYAGFAAPPGLTDEELLWTADSYARMAALCIRSSHGLAAVLARSSSDELTGCLDPRGLHEALAAEVQRSQREGHRLSCCLLGLDRAERPNDGRGRLERNRVLAAVGPALIESGRRYDLVARLDDDRFLVVLPETGGRAAVQVADRLRTQAKAAVAGATQAELGLSIGVGEWNIGDSVSDFLATANEALREAKRNGGGRVVADISTQRRFDGLVELAKDVVRGRPPPGQYRSPKPSSVNRGKEFERPTEP